MLSEVKAPNPGKLDHAQTESSSVCLCRVSSASGGFGMTQGRLWGRIRNARPALVNGVPLFVSLGEALGWDAIPGAEAFPAPMPLNLAEFPRNRAEIPG